VAQALLPVRRCYGKFPQLGYHTLSH